MVSSTSVRPSTQTKHHPGLLGESGAIPTDRDAITHMQQHGIAEVLLLVHAQIPAPTEDGLRYVQPERNLAS